MRDSFGIPHFYVEQILRLSFIDNTKRECWIKDNVSYEEVLVEIFDCQIRNLRIEEVALVKVLWKNQFIKEAIWEAEEDMKKINSEIFESRENVDQGIKFSS